MLYAIVGLLAIIADQWVKFWTMTHIPMTSPGESVVPGILSLANVHNDGAAFGFLSGNGVRIPFIVLAGVFTVVVIIALATNIISGRFARWCIVLVTAGGLSNCLDRVLYGYVQDMFKFDFINFPVFNLADVFITVFAILFALAVIFGKTRRDDDIDEDFLADDEEERLSRASRRKEKKAKKEKRSRRRRDEDYDDYDEDEEEEEEEEPAPVRVKKTREKKPSRRSRRRAEEEEFEDDDSDVEEAAVELPKSRKAAAKAPSGEDPFAAWDRANTASAEASCPAARKAAAAAAPVAEPTRRMPASSAAAQQPARQASRAQAAKAPAESAPKAKPAPTYRPVTEEEFSLDDILNEFR